MNKVYAALKKRDPEFVSGLQMFADMFNARAVTIDDLDTGTRVLDRTGRAKHLKAMDKLRGVE